MEVHKKGRGGCMDILYHKRDQEESHLSDMKGKQTVNRPVDMSIFV